MKKKYFINHYKIKKKIGRNVAKSKSIWSMIFGFRKKIRRDYSWDGVQNNPFKKNEKKREKRYLKIQLSIIIISIFITICVVLYHPFFAVNNIKITGVQRIKKTDIINTIHGFFSYKVWGILPQRSYFMADIEEIKDILKKRYPIKHIIIEKVFPNNLNIIIEEKISTIIYDNSNVYSYIDLQGNVVEIMRKVTNFEWDTVTKIVTSTNEIGEEIPKTEIVKKTHKPDVRNITIELGNYPIVYDMRHKDIISQQQVLDPIEVKTIVEWYNLLTKTTDIPLKYIIIENDIGDLIIETFERWYIKSRISRPVKTQIGELEYLFREKIKRDNLNYIDLRYPDRIYWK